MGASYIESKADDELFNGVIAVRSIKAGDVVELHLTGKAHEWTMQRIRKFSHVLKLIGAHLIVLKNGAKLEVTELPDFDVARKESVEQYGDAYKKLEDK